MRIAQNVMNGNVVVPFRQNDRMIDLVRINIPDLAVNLRLENAVVLLTLENEVSRPTRSADNRHRRQGRLR